MEKDRTRQWNVVSTLAVILTLVYVGAFAAAFLRGAVDGEDFRDGVLPVVTAVLVHLAGMLKDQP